MKASELIEALRVAIEKFGDRPVEFWANAAVKPHWEFRPADAVIDSTAFRGGVKSETLVIISSDSWVKQRAA